MFYFAITLCSSDALKSGIPNVKVWCKKLQTKLANVALIDEVRADFNLVTERQI